MNRLLLTIFFFPLLLGSVAQSDTRPVFANIVSPVKGKVQILKVPFPPFTKGQLQNDHVIVDVSALDFSLVEDCFCYDVSDPRFVYVNAYFYATKILEEYSAIFSNLSLPPMGPLEIKIDFDAAKPLSASLTGKVLYMTALKGAFDFTTFGHEVGHFIHRSTLDFHLQSYSKDDRESSQQMGIDEGTANILAALYFQVSKIGGFGIFEDRVVPNVDTFINVNRNPMSFRNFITLNMSSNYLQGFPSLMEKYRNILDSSENQAWLSLPDPYHSSAAIGQPVWRAAKKYGFERVQEVYVSALADLPKYNSYSDLTKKLIEKARNVDGLQKFWQEQFQKRGVY